MTAPRDFNPVNILQQGKQLPPPIRSRYRKFDIYRDVNQFRLVDEHAVQVNLYFSKLQYHLYSVDFLATKTGKFVTSQIFGLPKT